MAAPWAPARSPGLRHVKNPIALARLVMDRSPHVMLVGEGAEEFARLQGVEMVSNEYFRTPVRQRQLHRLLGGTAEKENDLIAFGTVGAVALDASGNLAAATSTGGMTGKRWGRVGDSPIIGAGTYADNASCAVSATGHGEYFIRAAVAHDICAQVEYLELPLEQAVANVLGKMKDAGRQWRRDRHRCTRRDRARFQQRRDVPRNADVGRQARSRDLPVAETRPRQWPSN